MEQEPLRRQLRQQLEDFLKAALPTHHDDLLLIFDRGEIGGQLVAEIAKFREFEDKLPRPWRSLHKPQLELQIHSDYMLRVGRMAVFAALRFLEHAHEFDEQETEGWLHKLRFDSADDGCESDESTSPNGRRKRKPKSEHPVRDVLRQCREQTLLFGQLVRAVAKSVDPKGSKQLTIDGCRVLCRQFLHDLTPDDDGSFKRFPCTTPGGGGSPLTRVGEAIYCACTGAPIDSRPKRSEGGKRTNRPKKTQLQAYTRPAPAQAASVEEQQFVASPIEQHQQQLYVPSVPVEATFCFNQVAPPAPNQSFEELVDKVLEAIERMVTYQQQMPPPLIQVPLFVPEMTAPPYPVMEPLPSDEVGAQDALDDDDWLRRELEDPFAREALDYCLSDDRDSLQKLLFDDGDLSDWCSMFDFAENETSRDETLSARSSPSPPSSPSLSSVSSDGSTSPTPFPDFPDDNPAKRARLGPPRRL